MINRFISLIIISSVLLSVDYETEIQPIFDNNCGNCHLGNSSGGLNLSNYNNLMSSDIVVPGDHEMSLLYQRIILPNSATGDMPPGNSSLSQSDIDLIALWIDEGALAEEEDPGDSCDAGLGDVNGDAVLNVLDVVSLAQFVLGGGPVTFECAADFNGDSLINVLDIVSLVNEILS